MTRLRTNGYGKTHIYQCLGCFNQSVFRVYRKPEDGLRKRGSPKETRGRTEHYKKNWKIWVTVGMVPAGCEVTANAPYER